MKRNLRGFITLMTILLMTAGAGPGHATDIKAAARAAVARWQKAVITVRLVAKIKSPRGEEENQFEVIGSVIDSSGLTIVSAQSVDPAATIKAVLSNMGRAGGEDLKIDSEITQTTMILQDGAEVEADVVLKDADLDLAFVRPRKAQTFDFIPLKPRQKPVDILDDIFVIDRLDRSQNRATGVNLGMIQALVKGPRTYYVANQELSGGSLGCIAFDADGNPVGLFVAKAKQNTGEKGMGALMNMMTSGAGASFTRIIRPIEDILEDAVQAKEAKAPQTSASQP